MLQGQYRFSNDTLINVNNSKEEMNHIIKHEFVHRLLTGSSSYGLLMIMMEKASLVDDSKKWIFEGLLDRTLRMQEQIATFIEYIEVLKYSGQEVFYKKILDLKRYNKKYYNYFNEINKYFINETMSDEEIDNITQLIIHLGILSLNIELKNIPFKKWEHFKDIQRFYTDKDNLLKYSPNKRFEVLLKFFLGEKEKHAVDAIYIMENSYEYNLDIVKYVIPSICDIYSDSSGLENIIQRVSKFETVTLDEGDIGDLALYNAFPSFSKNIQAFEVNYDTVEGIIKRLNINDSILYFNHILGGLEGLSYLMYISINKNDCYLGEYDDYNIQNIIERVNNPIVFGQSKLYMSIKKDILEHSPEKKIYIYMENAIASSWNIISNEFSDSKYILIPQENYDIIAIRNANHILIQIVIKGIKKELEEKLAEWRITPANFIEGTKFNYKEIQTIARVLFSHGNWAIKNKSYGFK